MIIWGKNMEKFKLREKEIFETLKQLAECEFVIIGGYAVNAYALPRFSVDCDIVIKKKELGEIEKKLQMAGYAKMEGGDVQPLYGGSFARYEKEIEKDFFVSFDVLVDAVYDRISGAVFSAGWVFENSKKRRLYGKTVLDGIDVRIINPDALFVLKFTSARETDIRDIFMMADKVENPKWAKKEISRKIDFERNFEKIREKICSKEFKKNLEGVYGFVENAAFEKRKKILVGMKNS